ncbi:hypothetical protein GN244_ATG02691 [Phytophthora infestans]|uniref:Secreted RxLR effector peptide protein n=1 Tax=Phytophthora infestans TaxID=4787 RepID=A0A833TJZ9_PHYIN|nr:hypothetical protein GN244_ATG02691 [Phytophthora infestans]
MRLYSAALLSTIAAFLSSSSVAGATADLQTTNCIRTLSDAPANSVTKRRLRASETGTNDNEDRVLNAAIEKLTGLAKAGALKISNMEWKFMLTGEGGADKILKWFDLDRGMKRALASPNLKVLESYVRAMNGKNKISVIGIFSTHYGDDLVAKSLVTMESKAKTPEAVNTIKNLRKDQLSAWMNSERSVDDVFNLLKLREDGYKALASPKMEVLDDYMKMVIQTKAGKETLLQTLTKGFDGEEKLARLLVRAKEHSKSKELATALQNALVKKWIEADNMTPDSVAHMLQLDRNLDALVNPNVHTLGAFISVYNARNPASKASLIGRFTTQYGDDVVALDLVYARSKSAKRPVAIFMQQQQFQAWQKSKKSAVDVFKQLDITPTDFEPVVSPKMEVLSGYINALNAANRDKTDLITVLIHGADGEGPLARGVITALWNAASQDRVKAVISTAAEYEKLLHKRWYRSKIEPPRIYTDILKVQETSAIGLDQLIVARYASYYSDKIAAARATPSMENAIRPRRS